MAAVIRLGETSPREQLPGRTIEDDFSGLESPKLKFNYTIQFKFRPNALRNPIYQATTDEGMTNKFAIKQASRMTPVVNYVDINYYGFRTKVATKVDFSVINLTFYDDSSNRATDIFKTYLSNVSPITNAPNANVLEDYTTVGALLDGSRLGPIEEVVLTHYHLNGAFKYFYYNPKITNVMLDELDMTSSDAANVTLTFVYDAVRTEYAANPTFINQSELEPAEPPINFPNPNLNPNPEQSPIETPPSNFDFGT